MNIKQSVINTFKRVGIDYKPLLAMQDKVMTANRFTGETVMTSPLIAYLVAWVYQTSNQYEQGNFKITISDFDRIRYFILEQDKNAYNVCID